MNNQTVALAVGVIILAFTASILKQFQGTFQRAAEKDAATTISTLDIIKIVGFPTVLASIVMLALLGVIEKEFIQNTFFLLIGYVLRDPLKLKKDNN